MPVIGNWLEPIRPVDFYFVNWKYSRAQWWFGPMKRPDETEWMNSNTNVRNKWMEWRRRLVHIGRHQRFISSGIDGKAMCDISRNCQKRLQRQLISGSESTRHLSRPEGKNSSGQPLGNNDGRQETPKIKHLFGESQNREWITARPNLEVRVGVFFAAVKRLLKPDRMSLFQSVISVATST